MFPTRMFCNRYFAPRYFPKVGAAPPPVTDNDFETALSEAALARTHFPKYGSAFGRNSFGFFLVWRPVWR